MARDASSDTLKNYFFIFGLKLFKGFIMLGSGLLLDLINVKKLFNFYLITCVHALDWIILVS